MADSIEGPGRKQAGRVINARHGRLRRFVQECDDGDLDVIRRALRTFVADAEQWSNAPHGDIGRARVMLSRLGGEL